MPASSRVGATGATPTAPRTGGRRSPQDTRCWSHRGTHGAPQQQTWHQTVGSQAGQLAALGKAGQGRRRRSVTCAGKVLKRSSRAGGAARSAPGVGVLYPTHKKRRGAIKRSINIWSDFSPHCSALAALPCRPAPPVAVCQSPASLAALPYSGKAFQPQHPQLRLQSV